jgi:hypothetical protein
MNTLSTLVEVIKISFIYGIKYKVIVQAFQSTVLPEDILKPM